MRLVKVQDNPGLMRDSSSNGIINVDDKAYETHKKRKRQTKAQVEKEKQIDDRINNLESEIKSLKTGIDQILSILKHDNN